VNKIGYTGTCTGTATNNYIWADGNAVETTLTGSNTFTGNTFAGSVPSGFQNNYPSNTYLPYGVALGGTHIFVTPSKYEPGRCHVAVYSWTKASSISLDLSSCLSAGDSYAIFDVQNWAAGPFQKGTYRGPVTVSVANVTTLQKPVGNVQASFPHTGVEFNAFVVLKTATATSVAVPAIYKFVICHWHSGDGFLVSNRGPQRPDELWSLRPPCWSDGE
jgi:hypothetical protein